jgi:hypothetical protein
MEEMQETQYSNREDDDPLAPISSEAVDRVAEIHSDSAPRKSVRQRLGSMAARRSADYLVEQVYVAERKRLLRSDTGPRTA